MFKVTAALLATGLVVSGCQTAGDFFGSRDPCQMAENAYSAFLVVSTTVDISDSAMRAAGAGIVAVREQCADGQIDKFTLNKSVNAYVRGLEAYRSN